MTHANICKINRLQSSDLICTKFVYETTDAQAKEFTEQENMPGIAVEGSGSLHGQSASFSLSPGTIFWVRRGKSFRISREGGLTYFYLCFGGRRA